MFNRSEKNVRWELVKSPHAAHMKCLNLIEAKKNVLDVGCTTGYLARELKKKGCHVVGMEKDRGRAEIAQKYCDKVFIGDAETTEIPYRNYFDVILFADVICFFRDPQEVLIRFKDYLKEDGYIVVSLPNVANWSIRLSLFFGNFDYEPTGITAIGYLKFFTAKTTKELLKKSGFKIEVFDITTNLKGSTRFGLIRFLANLNKNLFAYQFIIKAKIARD